MDSKEIESKLKAKQPHVVGFLMPKEGSTIIKDRLRGGVEIQNSQIDDQVILKSDGFPTYHLANIVDDHLMKITHVIRAEEWISSTPKHHLLYKAFGWQEPVWVHLPLLRNTDKSKISKRKNPVSLTYYMKAGVLPEALVNFLGLMGWNMGNDQEVFSLEDICQHFSFDQISLGSPVFDQTKLNWLNQQYIQKLEKTDFVKKLQDYLANPEYLESIYPLVKERFDRFDMFIDKHAFFFNGALDYSGLALIPKGKTHVEMKKMLKGLVEKLDLLYEWQSAKIHELFDQEVKELGWKARDFYMPIRLAVTGRKDSPPLTETIEVLGRDLVRFRLRDCMKSQALNGS